MLYEDNWLRSKDWIIEKMKNCDGALIPMDAESIQKRQEPELDYQFFLENASRTMIRFKNPEHLIRMIVRVIDEQLKVTHTGMLLYRRDRNSFIIIDSKGSAGLKIPVGFIQLTYENPLIKVFNERINFKISETGAIEYKELLNIISRNEKVKKDEKLVEAISRAIKQMELLKANICVPVYYKKDL